MDREAIGHLIEGVCIALTTGLLLFVLLVYWLNKKKCPVCGKRAGEERRGIDIGVDVPAWHRSIHEILYECQSCKHTWKDKERCPACGCLAGIKYAVKVLGHHNKTGMPAYERFYSCEKCKHKWSERPPPQDVEVPVYW